MQLRYLHFYTVSPINVHFFISRITLSKQLILIIFDMLNPEKFDMNTDLFTSPVRCSHFTLGNPKKSHFSTLLFIYFRLFTLPQKKTNSSCCTAALAVYLLLFSASCYLHSPSTASGACSRRSACIDTDVLRLAAAACCDMG